MAEFNEGSAAQHGGPEGEEPPAAAPAGVGPGKATAKGKQDPARPEQQPYSDEALLLTDAPVPGRARPLAPAHKPAADLGAVWVETITTADQLAAIAGACEELAAAAIEPNPFYEPWMLVSALRSFGAGRDLELVLVWGPHPSRRKGERQLLGLFPIEWRQVGPVRVAQLWRYRYCYLCTPHLRAGAGQAALASFFDWVQAKAALLRLPEIAGDGEFHDLLVDELNRRKWPSQVSAWYTRALLKAAPSGEDYLERALAGKRRKELRRQKSRLSEQGQLDLCDLGPGDDLKPWLNDFVTLEAAGWKGRDAVAVQSREADLRWFAEMSVEALRRGRLMMLGLKLDGRPIALKYNLLAGEGSFAFKIAYDETWARFSPGVLLELENVQRVHDRKALRWMDSCAAPNRFMINHLWTERRPIQTLFIAPGGRRKSLLLALLPLARWARALVRPNPPPRPQRRSDDAT